MGGRAGGVGWAAALLLSSLAAAAPRARGAEEAAPPVPLERLLRLPAATPGPGLERRGGVTRSQWEARFGSAREAVRHAERELEQTRAELEEASEGSEAWTMAAPGLGSASAEETPLDYKLSQTLRRQREAVERAQRELRDLEVEANLAGVPATWRAAPEPEAAGGGDPSGAGGAAPGASPVP